MAPHAVLQGCHSFTIDKYVRYRKAYSKISFSRMNQMKYTYFAWVELCARSKYNHFLLLDKLHAYKRIHSILVGSVFDGTCSKMNRLAPLFMLFLASNVEFFSVYFLRKYFFLQRDLKKCMNCAQDLNKYTYIFFYIFYIFSISLKS